MRGWSGSLDAVPAIASIDEAAHTTWRARDRSSWFGMAISSRRCGGRNRRGSCRRHCRRSCRMAWGRAFQSTQEDARWLLQRPVDRSGHRSRASRAGARTHHALRRPTAAAIWRTRRSRRPARWRCFATGSLQVWTHSQGVYPLKAALSRMLKLDPAAISVQHVQGPGCYGHNGADDAAADAAVIAMRMPGKPIRVRWRREEEFAFEPVSSRDGGHGARDASMHPDGRRTGPPKSGAARTARVLGRDGALLAEQALPDPPPPRGARRRAGSAAAAAAPAMAIPCTTSQRNGSSIIWCRTCRSAPRLARAWRHRQCFRHRIVHR